MSKPKSVALVTLGCARNDVDSEELAGRLAADGWQLVDDVATADVALVNTCGFIESAKKDSVDALIEAHSMGAGTGFARSVRVSSTHLAHPLAHGWRGQASTRGSADGTHALPSVAMSSCGGW